jgi:hypothetical protein
MLKLKLKRIELEADVLGLDVLPDLGQGLELDHAQEVEVGDDLSLPMLMLDKYLMMPITLVPMMMPSLSRLKAGVELLEPRVEVVLPKPKSLVAMMGSLVVLHLLPSQTKVEVGAETTRHDKVDQGDVEPRVHQVEVEVEIGVSELEPQQTIRIGNTRNEHLSIYTNFWDDIHSTLLFIITIVK